MAIGVNMLIGPHQQVIRPGAIMVVVSLWHSVAFEGHGSAFSGSRLFSETAPPASSDLKAAQNRDFVSKITEYCDLCRCVLLGRMTRTSTRAY